MALWWEVRTGVSICELLFREALFKLLHSGSRSYRTIRGHNCLRYMVGLLSPVGFIASLTCVLCVLGV